MPKELHKAARIKAIEQDRALSDVVRQFLQLWVDGEIELPGEEDNSEKK